MSQTNTEKFDDLLQRIITLSTQKGKIINLGTKAGNGVGKQYETICTWPNTDKNIQTTAVVGENGLSKIMIHRDFEPIPQNLCHYTLRYYVDKDTKDFSGNVGDRFGAFTNYGSDQNSLTEILQRINFCLGTMEKRLLVS